MSWYKMYYADSNSNYADLNLFFDPSLEMSEYRAFNCTLDMEIGASGTLTFALISSNPAYDEIVLMKTVIIVKNNTGNEIWRGRAISYDKDWYGTKSFTCEGVMGYLLDSLCRPSSYLEKTREDYLKARLKSYNNNVDAVKQIGFGGITFEDEESDNKATFTTYDFSTVYDDLNDKLINAYSDGGYFQIKHDDTATEAPYLLFYWREKGDKHSDQTIEFGVNLMDYAESVSAEDFFTVLVPLGPYVDDSSEGKRYSIRRAETESDKYPTYKTYGMIVDTDLAEKYGYIEKTVIFDDVSISTDSSGSGANNMYNYRRVLYRAVRYLDKYYDDLIGLDMTLSVKAVDLSFMGVDVDAIEVGDDVKVISAPHGVNAYFTCTGISYNLSEPGETEFTFGSNFKTLSSE